MTDNEALKKHKEDCKRCRDKACKHNHQCLQKKDIEAYERLMAFEAIGTIDEFKALKEKEHNYENCHNFTCRNKSREVGFNIGYSKAIDEFAERMKNNLVLRYGNATATEQYVAMQATDWCNEIAEQLKGGAVDG